MCVCYHKYNATYIHTTKDMLFMCHCPNHQKIMIADNVFLDLLLKVQQINHLKNDQHVLSCLWLPTVADLCKFPNNEI